MSDNAKVERVARAIYEVTPMTGGTGVPPEHPFGQPITWDDLINWDSHVVRMTRNKARAAISAMQPEAGTPALNAPCRTRQEVALECAIRGLTAIARPAENETALEKLMRQAATVALERINALLGAGK